MNGPRQHAILVVAGEPSGDRAAADVVRRFGETGTADFFGVGGEKMGGAGVHLLSHIDRLTALGLAESVRRLRSWADAWCRVREAVSKRKPRVALLVDSPETNLPLARVLTEAGVKVVLYVGPQVWAWRGSRLLLRKKRVDITALVLPFEKALYDAAGVPSEFVGHPIMDQKVTGDRAWSRERLGVASSDPLVAFLPGSRSSEIRRHGPEMNRAATGLQDSGIRTVVVPAEAQRDATVRAFAPSGAMVAPKTLSTRQVLRGADAAVVASGTATLEATVERVPHLIVYRTDAASYALGKRMIKSPFIGLPNLIAGREVCKELVQDALTSDNIEANVKEILDDDTERTAALAGVARKLGAEGAATRVAGLLRERLQ